MGFNLVVYPCLEAESSLIGIEDLALPVTKDPVLVAPVDVEKISCGDRLILGAKKAQARDMLERLTADGTLLIGTDLALHLPDLRLNLVEKIFQILGICNKKRAQIQNSSEPRIPVAGSAGCPDVHLLLYY